MGIGRVDSMGAVLLRSAHFFAQDRLRSPLDALVQRLKTCAAFPPRMRSSSSWVSPSAQVRTISSACL